MKITAWKWYIQTAQKSYIQNKDVLLGLDMFYRIPNHELNGPGP